MSGAHVEVYPWLVAISLFMKHFALPCLWVLLVSPTLRAESVTYPAEAGVLNVRDVAYGAKGDGQADDTAAIQKALASGLAQHRIVYLPNGIYRVTDTLRWNNGDPQSPVGGWGPFLQLQGQSRAGTILRLPDHASGFDDPTHPKAVVQTGSSGADGHKAYHDGEGNEAFENHLRDFTVEIGAGNAGAVGVDYQASNVGAMRHVTVRAAAGSGYCGVSLTRRDNGPGLLKDVAVEGCRYGLRLGQEIAQFTLEDVGLSGQGECGVWCHDAVLAVRGLRSRNAGPAVRLSGVALLVLLDAELVKTGDGVGAAIVSDASAQLALSRLQTTGYPAAVERGGKVAPPGGVEQWTSQSMAGNGGAADDPSLKVKETPEWTTENPAEWADAGPPSGGDDAPALQRVLDSGKLAVRLRYGTYRVGTTLRVPPSVRRLEGTGTSLETLVRLPDEQPLLRCAGGTSTHLTIIDRLACSAHGGSLVGHEDARTLVLRDIIPFDAQVYRGGAGAGPLFVEDVSGAGYRFAKGARVWARQWNCEGTGGPKAVNDGGEVWALGWKTEGGETLAVNRNGGHMELLGGLAYSFGVDPQKPLFVNEGASLVLSFCGTSYMGPNGFFTRLVQGAGAGKVADLTRADVPGRGGGVSVPLYVSPRGP